MRLSVIGCGYLGVTHAAAMVELGHEVVGVDVDQTKLDTLNEGFSPFHEPGLDELVGKGRKTGRLRFTDDYREVADWADAHFLCVSTPQKSGELAADLSQVHAAIDTLGPLLTRRTLIVGKSTVPVGTAARLRSRVREAAPAGDEVDLAWNPEFLREGHAVEDSMRPDRLVIGVAQDDHRAEQELRLVYASLLDHGTPVRVTNLETAELVKTAANGFLATKISYINAMAEICEASGASVTALADAIGLDGRIGPSFLNAGIGYGGGCLPKDIRAFIARAGELGLNEAVGILREVDATNERQRHRVVSMALEMLGGRAFGTRVAVLGAAFKPDSDDIRDSPALNVAGRLHLMGSHVVVYDPQARPNAQRDWPTLGYAESIDTAVAGADLVLVLTEWREFHEAVPAHLGTLVRHQRVLDGRNCLALEDWRAAGWVCRSIGNP